MLSALTFLCGADLVLSIPDEATEAQRALAADQSHRVGRFQAMIRIQVLLPQKSMPLTILLE